MSQSEIEAEADRIDATPHPRRTTGLVAHRGAERELLDAYRAERLPHAVILGGPAGIGKATLAWRLARFILANPLATSPAVRAATDLSVDPTSKVALQIASLSHPDITLLRREVNDKTKRFYTEIRADDVRRTIQLFQRASSAGGYRICIIDSAEDLNRSSANALLKLIEEPPPKSLFILVAHRAGAVLPTIRSRARLIRLQSLVPPEIEAVIASLGPPWTDQPEAVRAEAAARARGSIHDALRLVGSRDLEIDAAVRRLLERLPSVDWREVHRLADQVGGRDAEAAFAAALNAVYDWLAASVHDGAVGQGGRASNLVRFADAWVSIAANARETEALNLDKRPLILSIFADLAAAARSAA